MNAFFAALTAILSSLFGSRKRAATTTSAGILAAAAVFIGPWEGERTEAYLDRVASPPVWTVCYGETRGVRPGDSYTSEECSAMLMEALKDYRAPLNKCIPSLPQQPEGVQVALISWAYNVGPGAACGSTLAKRANADRWADACNELLRWDKAGGRTVRGLTNRRRDENKLCLDAVNAG